MLLVAAGCGGGEDSGNSTTRAATSASFTNPVWDDNFPDPFVLRAGGAYHAYGTNGSDGNVPTLKSRDLVHWTQGADALPELGSWASFGKTWAPEVLARSDGTFVLYYTAAAREAGRQCVGAAVASRPEGPFVDSRDAPLVCQAAQGGSIDASPFADGDALYLLWKNDGNAIGKPSYIWSQRLADDGLSLVGRAARLETSDRPWEKEWVEAPTLWRQKRTLYLFYSAGHFYDATYAVGYATCTSPLGPCRDAPGNPIVKTACDAVGPGHQAIVRDDDGDTWLVYHAWPRDAVGSEVPGRVLWIDRLEWDGGKPDVAGPTCDEQPLP